MNVIKRYLEARKQAHSEGRTFHVCTIGRIERDELINSRDFHPLSVPSRKAGFDTPDWQGRGEFYAMGVNWFVSDRESELTLS